MHYFFICRVQKLAASNSPQVNSGFVMWLKSGRLLASERPSCARSSTVGIKRRCCPGSKGCAPSGSWLWALVVVEWLKAMYSTGEACCDWHGYAGSSITVPYLVGSQCMFARLWRMCSSCSGHYHFICSMDAFCTWVAEFARYTFTQLCARSLHSQRADLRFLLCDMQWTVSAMAMLWASHPCYERYAPVTSVTPLLQAWPLVCHVVAQNSTCMVHFILELPSIKMAYTMGTQDQYI